MDLRSQKTQCCDRLVMSAMGTQQKDGQESFVNSMRKGTVPVLFTEVAPVPDTWLLAGTH